MRVAVVLSGGGLRGAGHIGVLQQLIAHGIPIDVIVGSSAGAVIAAYYAAVGLTLDELIADAQHFRGRHLLAHSLNVRLHHRFSPAIGKLTGVIPARLEQLERASFDRLHHGVQAIGIVCHDVKRRQACYFATGNDRDVRLSDIVRASASVPLLFPSTRVDCCGESLLLTDGGVSDCLPIAFAQRPPLSATHLIVSDCRWFAGGPIGAGLKASTTTEVSATTADSPETSEHLVYVRPRLFTTGTLWAPSSTLVEAVRQGAAAVTDEILERLGPWRRILAPSTQPAG